MATIHDFIIELLKIHTNYLHKWLVHLNFDVFTAAVFIYICKISKYVPVQNNILSYSMGVSACIAIIWK